MRHLRIYDYRGDLIADLPNVTSSNVTNPGVLVVRLAPASPAGITLRAFAAGYWGEVSEVPTVLPIVPIMPGPVTDADIDALMAGSDAAAVRAAMTIHCLCDSLRCTTVLNPASREEKEAARTRWRRQPAGPPPPSEPLQRCVQARGHDQEATPCYWALGVWTYGAAEHHSSCPRHPSRYNGQPQQQEEEGQPQEAAAGFTSPTYVPVQVFAEPEPEVSTTLVRPYIEAAGQGGLTGLDRADVPALFEFEPFLRQQREMWKVCAVPGPDTYPFPTWCTMAPSHDGALHEMDRSDERISWQRQGGRR